MFVLLRQLQNAGLIDDNEYAQIFAEIEACLRFEIDFQSSLTIEREALPERFTVRAIVPIRLEPGVGGHYLLSGSAPIRYEFVNVTQPPCTVSVQTKDGVFVVDRLAMGLEGFPRRAQLSIDMVYRPGDPQESHGIICLVGTEPTHGPFLSNFRSFYDPLHSSEKFPGDFTYLASRWEPVLSGNFIAKKIYKPPPVSLGSQQVREETFIFLKHTPE